MKIDSEFIGYLFQQIDIDPLFRMADESEIAILRADVLKDLIEERYKDPDEDFLQFVNFYTDKSDSKLEKTQMQKQKAAKFKKYLGTYEYYYYFQNVPDENYIVPGQEEKAGVN